MADLTRAQIRRATLAAHREIERLDAETLATLAELYADEAAAIAARIRAHAGPGDSVALQELRSLLNQVEGILRRLTTARDALLEPALETAAGLGADAILGAMAPSGQVLRTAASMRVSESAVRFVQEFVAADGLTLSDRLWRMDRGARDAVVNAIESGVIQGHGATQAAREFLMRGAAVPDAVQARAGMASAPALTARTDALMTGEMGAEFQAARVFRTELNRAHGEAYMAGGEDHPDFAGWRYLLSPAHPEPDICDLLSTQNLHGLGEGVYPDRESCPWPAHPNTLSFVRIVFRDEVSDVDRAGKETPMQALARLPRERLEGVLGKGKTAVYDAGKLTQGMIRAPLSAVLARVGGV
jgi:hypothetical protein